MSGARATCYDCGRPYGDEHGFPDLLVPNWVWERISPTGGEGGLLCPSCMAQRCAAQGIRCRARWMSGPFVEDHEPEEVAEWMRERAGVV